MRTKLVIHHSGDQSESNQFEKINAYHKGKGFPISSLGFHAGYTFIGERSGEVKQCRGLEDMGAHTLGSCDGSACNVVAFGYCFAGNFTIQEPNDVQLASFYSVWKNLNYPKLILHSEVKRTSCPGFYDFRAEMTRRYLLDLKQRLTSAIAALPRFLGTPRGNMITRLITRLRKTKDVE